MIGEIEPGREEPAGLTPLGPVWVKSFASAGAPIGLRRALKDRAHYYREAAPPPGDAPSAIVCCCPDARQEAVASEVRSLAALAPHAVILVLGTLCDVGLARAALGAGARGFLHAGMPPEQIARAVSVAVDEGKVVLPRGLLEGLLAEERGRPNTSCLRPRQREVLGLVAEGLSNAQIARRLFLSESTVKQHLRAAYKALGVKNRRQAASVIRRNGPLEATGRLTSSA